MYSLSTVPQKYGLMANRQQFLTKSAVESQEIWCCTHFSEIFRHCSVATVHPDTAKKRLLFFLKKQLTITFTMPLCVSRNISDLINFLGSVKRSEESA